MGACGTGAHDVARVTVTREGQVERPSRWLLSVSDGSTVVAALKAAGATEKLLLNLTETPTD